MPTRTAAWLPYPWAHKDPWGRHAFPCGLPHGKPPFEHPVMLFGDPDHYVYELDDLLADWNQHNHRVPRDPMHPRRACSWASLNPVRYPGFKNYQATCAKLRQVSGGQWQDIPEPDTSAPGVSAGASALYPGAPYPNELQQPIDALARHAARRVMDHLIGGTPSMQLDPQPPFNVDRTRGQIYSDFMWLLSQQYPGTLPYVAHTLFLDEWQRARAEGRLIQRPARVVRAEGDESYSVKFRTRFRTLPDVVRLLYERMRLQAPRAYQHTPDNPLLDAAILICAELNNPRSFYFWQRAKNDRDKTLLQCVYDALCRMRDEQADSSSSISDTSDDDGL